MFESCHPDFIPHLRDKMKKKPLTNKAGQVRELTRKDIKKNMRSAK